MSMISSESASFGLINANITLSEEDSAAYPCNHQTSSHVRPMMPDSRSIGFPRSSESIDVKEYGWSIHHEAREAHCFGIGTSETPRGLSPLSSASLYLRTQTSTPWAMFAKSRRSTFIWRYSISSGGRVIVIDTFLRTIMHIPSVRNNTGIRSYLNCSAHSECAEVPAYEARSISGSYTGDQDDTEVRGDTDGGKQHSDSVSGAEHSCRSFGFSCPFPGAGVRIAHEEGRFRSGIDAVRAVTGVRGCAA